MTSDTWLKPKNYNLLIRNIFFKFYTLYVLFVPYVTIWLLLTHFRYKFMKSRKTTFCGENISKIKAWCSEITVNKLGQNWLWRQMAHPQIHSHRVWYTLNTEMAMKTPVRITFWWKANAFCLNLFSVVSIQHSERLLCHHLNETPLCCTPVCCGGMDLRFTSCLSRQSLGSIGYNVHKACQQSKVWLQPDQSWISILAPKIE